MLEAFHILNHLYFLTLVGSLLSMLALRLLTGSTTSQIDLIGEYRTSVERATRNGLARKMWRAPTEEPGGVLWETGTDRRRSFGVKRCGWH